MSEFEARLFYSTTRGLVYTSLNITTQVKIRFQNMLRRSNANDLFWRQRSHMLVQLSWSLSKLRCIRLVQFFVVPFSAQFNLTSHYSINLGKTKGKFKKAAWRYIYRCDMWATLKTLSPSKRTQEFNTLAHHVISVAQRDQSKMHLCCTHLKVGYSHRLTERARMWHVGSHNLLFIS